MKNKPSKEFRAETLRIHEKRNHKIKGSMKVYDIFYQIPLEERQGIDIKLFRKIIRKVNLGLCEEISIGNIVKLPCNMGGFGVQKIPTKNKIVNGKLENNLVIDWYRTLALWEEDEESRLNKTLVKFNTKNKFHLAWIKNRLQWKNHRFYHFWWNRELRVLIKENLNSGKLIDAFSNMTIYD